ncbi:hypothetical protein BS50DRAFT_580422 [Corynespora cassiicola Philippines]|uniref:MADS-box domain-containing protein n=1 Tax=Corynespora cassiicola Philippines TaxID=1448308 RepID=A0A2T2N060_CORCC|nr:hypothetical protein BS50DRAFT_580422 [Corynespora cassiicola Philippines]
MPSEQQPERLQRAKARRAANNSYQKLTKTLFRKLAKISQDYDTKVYYLAYRNGRFHVFASVDDEGRPWSPPSQRALDRLYPPPAMNSPSSFPSNRQRQQKTSG